MRDISDSMPMSVAAITGMIGAGRAAVGPVKYLHAVNWLIETRAPHWLVIHDELDAKAPMSVLQMIPSKRGIETLRCAWMYDWALNKRNARFGTTLEAHRLTEVDFADYALAWLVDPRGTDPVAMALDITQGTCAERAEVALRVLNTLSRMLL